MDMSIETFETFLTVALVAFIILGVVAIVLFARQLLSRQNEGKKHDKKNGKN